MLLSLLKNYHPTDEHEEAMRDCIRAFVTDHGECFQRSLTIGHVTASAWLLNLDGSRVLLTHHRKLDRWLQLGGHVDGQSDVLQAALREAMEESGIDEIVPISRAIFDVDIHQIPEHGGESAHFHYDIRFLLQVRESERFVVSVESKELRWVSKEELPALPTDESVLRMHRKWLALPSSLLAHNRGGWTRPASYLQ